MGLEYATDVLFPGKDQTKQGRGFFSLSQTSQEQLLFLESPARFWAPAQPTEWRMCKSQQLESQSIRHKRTMSSKKQTFRREVGHLSHVVRQQNWSCEWKMLPYPLSLHCPFHAFSKPCTQQTHFTLNLPKPEKPPTWAAYRNHPIPSETWPLCKTSWKQKKRSNETDSAGSFLRWPGVNVFIFTL